MMRFAVTGLTLVLAFGITACGGDDDASGDGGGSGGKSTVTMWMYPVIADQDASDEFWSGIESDFEAQNSDIDLKIELQPWDGRQETITTALSSGTGFDIVLLGPDQVPQYVDQGSLSPVDDMVADVKDSFLPTAVDSFSVDGELYGVPIYQTVVAPMYNKAVFEEAGVSELPKTWDEVKSAASALAEQGVPILDYPGDPEETLNLTFYPLLWQAGGTVFADDGQSVAFDGPEGVEALQFLVDLTEVGGLPADAATTDNAIETRDFSAGKAGILHGADLAQMRQVAELVGKKNIVAGEPLTNAEQVTFGLPGGLTVSHAAEDSEAVGEVLRFMASEETIKALSGASGFFPSRTDVEMPDDGPYAADLAAALPMALPGDTHPQARQVMSIIAPQVQAALLGKKSAEQALSDAADEANAILAGG